MNSNWSYSPETVKLGCDLCDLDLWPLTLTFCMDLTFVIGNNSWKLYDDGNIVKKVWRTDGQMDRQTENTICRAAWSQLKTWKLGTDVYFTNWLQHHCGKKKNLETTRAIWSKPLFASCVALDQLNHDVYIFHGTTPLHYDQSHYFVPCALPLAS